MSLSFSQFRDAVEEGIASGEHFGVQVALSRKGDRLIDEAIGQNAPFEPLEADHVLLWLSACKPLMGVAMGLLMDRGQMELDRPVMEWIPDFGSKGKEGITPRHLITHTAGIRGATLGWVPRPWDEVIGTINYIKPEPRWEPGKQAGYHVDSAWYMLAELLRLIDGRNYGQFVREEIFSPLGMDHCFMGMSEAELEANRERMAWIYDCSGEVPEIQPDLNSDASMMALRPGGNGRGPANEFLLLYEAMLRMTRGEAGILRPETARDLVDLQRVGLLDKTFRETIDWGLGFMRQSDHYHPGKVPYQFGSHASRASFGHCGNQSTAAFCDPEEELCVIVLCNGMPGEEAHQVRMRGLLDALHADLF